MGTPLLPLPVLRGTAGVGALWIFDFRFAIGEEDPHPTLPRSSGRDSNAFVRPSPPSGYDPPHEPRMKPHPICHCLSVTFLVICALAPAARGDEIRDRWNKI